MTGLRLDARAMAVTGGAGTLLYLIAQQVHSFSSIVMPNEDTSFLVTSESLSSWGVGWMGGG